MPVQFEGNLPEKEVLEGCIRGNGKCQRLLYKAYSSKMFGICLRYAKNYHNAEDLLQEGFIRVFNSIGRFRFEGSFEGWMRRVFVNTALEHLRQAVHIRSIDESNGLEYTPLLDGIEDELNADELLKMVQSLSDGFRTIFNLYAIEGYSHQEIGEMLGISEGTSKSQLARARALLQKMVLESKQYKSISEPKYKTKYETNAQSR